jgi:hypothetical protein
MRLRDRNKFPPGGFRFYVPETRWSIQPWVSFDVAVQQIIQHRQANPFLTQSKGWSTDPGIVADELDAFNAAVCEQMRWMDFIGEGGGPAGPPKAMSHQSPSSRSAQVVAGVKTIAAWELAGGNVVDRALANARAKTCSACIKNESGDLLSFFTEQAARLIKLQLETKNNMKLSTDFDPLLGVCSACGCVNKLKVWAPLDIILKEMKPETKAALAANCWVLNEK